MMKEMGKAYQLPKEEKKQKPPKQKAPDAIKLGRIYEHQFYDDFFEFEKLNEEIKQAQLDFDIIP